MPCGPLKPWRSRKRVIRSRWDASSSMTRTSSPVPCRPSRVALTSGSKARSGRTAGTRRVKQVPRPSTLSTVTSPPRSFANARLSANPRPVPPNLRVVVSSAWANRWNRRETCSGVMPMPVSRTVNTIQSPPVPGSLATPSVILPPSVNLAALLSKLNRHCRSLTASERMVPTSSATSRTSSFDLRWTSASTVPAASTAKVATSMSSAKTSIIGERRQANPMVLQFWIAAMQNCNHVSTPPLMQLQPRLAC